MAILSARIDPARLAGDVGSGLRNVASDAGFILIYLAFLFPASAVMPKKFNFIFGRGEATQGRASRSSNASGIRWSAICGSRRW